MINKAVLNFKLFLFIQISCFLLPAKSQPPCGELLNNWGVYNYTVPAGINKISFAARGADGGNALVINQDVFGNITSCVSSGGSGAEIKATFLVGLGANHIPPGSDLVYIIGQFGENHASNIFLGTGYAYGGGGGGQLYY